MSFVEVGPSGEMQSPMNTVHPPVGELYVPSPTHMTSSPMASSSSIDYAYCFELHGTYDDEKIFREKLTNSNEYCISPCPISGQSKLTLYDGNKFNFKIVLTTEQVVTLFNNFYQFKKQIKDKFDYFIITNIYGPAGNRVSEIPFDDKIKYIIDSVQDSSFKQIESPIPEFHVSDWSILDDKSLFNIKSLALIFKDTETMNNYIRHTDKDLNLKIMVEKMKGRNGFSRSFIIYDTTDRVMIQLLKKNTWNEVVVKFYE